jgi:hypothetical protein
LLSECRTEHGLALDLIKILEGLSHETRTAINTDNEINAIVANTYNDIARLVPAIIRLAESIERSREETTNIRVTYIGD